MKNDENTKTEQTRLIPLNEEKHESKERGYGSDDCDALEELEEEIEYLKDKIGAYGLLPHNMLLEEPERPIDEIESEAMEKLMSNCDIDRANADAIVHNDRTQYDLEVIKEAYEEGFLEKAKSSLKKDRGYVKADELVEAIERSDVF